MRWFPFLVCFGFAPAMAVPLPRAVVPADGWTVSVAVPESLAARPVEASFDDKGRLYVTEVSGTNEPPEVQLKKAPHRLLRLEDTDGDGTFDQRTVFAEKLGFPEGVLWHDGMVYVAVPPQILKFTDKDGDGTADERTVWFDGKTLTGCANDLHGPYAGPDGLLYWCKGAFAEQTHDLPGRMGWKSRAAHVFRMKPDGSAFDVVFTAGMDNPVGLAWTPEGDLIVSGTFLQHPGDGKRDGLIHAVRGGLWGKDHDVLDGHPRTGPLLPPMTHLGPAAPAGMCRIGRDLLVCQFNLRKVSRHVLTPDGATWKTADSDFLTSDDPDFHPTDVLQAPDGSVLVVDTGGWYKLCCPTSQVAKPEATGAIYRLRKAGGEVPLAFPEPRWRLTEASSVAALLADLKSPELHVRRLALEVLAERRPRQPDFDAAHPEAVAAMLAAVDVEGSDRFLQHAVTHALQTPPADEALRALLQHETSARRVLAALPALHGPLPAAAAERLLAFPDDRVRRAAASLLSGPVVFAWVSERLGAENDPEALRAAVAAIVDREARGEAGDAVLLPAARGAAAQRLVLEEMRRRAEGMELPAAWQSSLLGLVRADDAAVAVEAARVLATAEKVDAAVSDLARQFAADARVPAALRLELMKLAGSWPPDDEQFRFLTGILTNRPGEPAADAAALAISRARLNAAQLRSLVPAVAAAPLLRRPVLLRAYGQCRDAAIGHLLVDAMVKAGTLTGLSDAALREATAAFPDDVRERLAAARTAPAPDAAAMAARLEELEKTLPAGDAQRGKVVFQSAGASCALCHQAGYLGRHLGPDLTKIGAVRTRRDLLEAIAFPSASFVRSYEPLQVKRRDGSIAYGIIANEGTAALTLTTGPVTPPVTIPREEIAEITPGAASLMPQGIDRILPAQELADLAAFLQSLR